ncbi:MAG: DUF4179 domain-containing protein [Clostridiaceae bacterium]|nr:DUF4179 domain-containing protein [Clostridiaceae bacterium]
MNMDYDNIKIPDNIDEFIDRGIKNAIKKSKKKRIKVRALKIVATFTIFIVGVGITSPATAAKIPIIGNVFETIEKDIYFPGAYSEYATSINQTVHSNGIDMTMSEILCDGESLYVTYIVESKKPFKYTSWGDEPLSMNQLITNEEYNKVDFTDEKLDNSGIAGLEGKFVDENTFVGMERYKLTSLNTEVPDEFTFQVKYTSILTHSLDEERIKDEVTGTWAFKVPVKVNKDISKEIKLNNVGNNAISFDSVILTPFETIINITFKDEKWHSYYINIYDEKGNELLPSEGHIVKGTNNKMIDIFQVLPAEDKRIRIVVEKMGDTEEQKEIVFDEYINVK